MGLLLNTPVAKKSPTLLVPLESYLYLQEKCHKERTGKAYTEKQKARLTRNFNNNQYKGFYQLLDKDLGGCKGNPENAWEERRWTSWSVEDMINILKEANLPYERGADTEYIAL